MRLRKVFVCAAVMTVLSGGVMADEFSQPNPYVTQRSNWACEVAGGVVGFAGTALLLTPVAFVAGDMEPQWIGDAVGVTSIALIAGTTGLGTWLSGRWIKERGSLGGAIVGAALGEVAWLGLPELLAMIPSNNMSKFDPGFALYYAGMALPPLCALAGYKLIPPIAKKETPSLGLNVAPLLNERGAGVAVYMSF